MCCNLVASCARAKTMDAAATWEPVTSLVLAVLSVYILFCSRAVWQRVSGGLAPLELGTRVRVHGLQAKPELNGCTAHIISARSKSGMYALEFEPLSAQTRSPRQRILLVHSTNVKLETGDATVVSMAESISMFHRSRQSRPFTAQQPISTPSVGTIDTLPSCRKSPEDQRQVVPEALPPATVILLNRRPISPEGQRLAVPKAQPSTPLATTPVPKRHSISPEDLRRVVPEAPLSAPVATAVLPKRRSISPEDQQHVVPEAPLSAPPAMAVLPKRRSISPEDQQHVVPEAPLSAPPAMAVLPKRRPRPPAAPSSLELCHRCLEPMPPLTWRGNERNWAVCCGNQLCASCWASSLSRRVKDTCELCHTTAPNTPADKFEAVRRHAEAGEGWALVMLGNKYQSGSGVARNPRLAFECFKRATLHPDPHPSAWQTLGSAYLAGTGVETDYKEAKRWLMPAAEAGHAIAMHNMGQIFSQGLGVRSDQKKAAEWWLRGAQAGSHECQCELGCAYESGEGVSASEAQARRWLLAAAKQGNATAQFKYGGLLFRVGKADGEPEMLREAVEWCRKSAQGGHVDAMQMLKQVQPDVRWPRSPPADPPPRASPAKKRWKKGGTSALLITSLKTQAETLERERTNIAPQVVSNVAQSAAEAGASASAAATASAAAQVPGPLCSCSGSRRSLPSSFGESPCASSIDNRSTSASVASLHSSVGESESTPSEIVVKPTKVQQEAGDATSTAAPVAESPKRSRRSQPVIPEEPTSPPPAGTVGMLPKRRPRPPEDQRRVVPEASPSAVPPAMLVVPKRRPISP